MSCCHTYKSQLVEHVRETCYTPHSVTLGGVPNTYIVCKSQDYQIRQLNNEEDNLSRLIRMSHNSHTHTGNTRQPEPQLKSFSCSSAIMSHNSRDVIMSHNSRNAMCLTPILSHNSRDTFRAITEGTLQLPHLYMYHQSLVDHAHQKQQALYLCVIA